MLNWMASKSQGTSCLHHLPLPDPVQGLQKSNYAWLFYLVSGNSGPASALLTEKSLQTYFPFNEKQSWFTEKH